MILEVVESAYEQSADVKVEETHVLSGENPPLVMDEIIKRILVDRSHSQVNDLQWLASLYGCLVDSSTASYDRF
jgi:hypothetical protein